MIDIYEHKNYYIPSYIASSYKSTSPYNINILNVVEICIWDHIGGRKLANLHKADYILSDRPLSLTSRDTYTFMDIYEAIKLESRSVVWTEPEIKNLMEMLESLDDQTHMLGRSVLCGMDPKVIKEMVTRGYLSNYRFPLFDTMNKTSEWEKFSNYYIMKLIKGNRKHEVFT
jgi:hypothetical protein